MRNDRIQAFVDESWESHIIPTLLEYIRIPCKSPLFDPEWQKHGYMDEAVEMVAQWCRSQGIEGLQQEIVRLPERTPLLYLEVPGTAPGTVLLYGHLDKQPEMEGWDADKGPWTPVVQDGRLYGRGGADDGYAAFSAINAIAALQEEGLTFPRCVILIEASEESGSPDLPAYLEHLAERIGDVDLVICLDSGAGNYDQMWCTTSLRGMVLGTLQVELLREGVHSGDASGIVPSTFRIARQLLSRLEDEKSGAILPSEFHAEIPQVRREQAEAAVRVLGSAVVDKFPWIDGGKTVDDDLTELILNRTWRPFLAVTGAGGMPPIESAGNVMRPRTALKLSLRLPPTVDATKATAALKSLLERDPPYGARVSFEPRVPGPGWNAPEIEPWLLKSMDEASRAYFGRPVCFMGEGGSIPFMALLARHYPRAQFLITGVLGPHSNAHGPNEFLELSTARQLTSCVAHVLGDHAQSR